MKSIQLLIITLISVIITSCGGGFNNFNSQKYTGLKSLPTAYQVIEKEEVPNEISPVKKVAQQEELVTEIEFNSPESDALKKAISEEEVIVVKKGDTYYLVEEPIYDQFYNALHGKLIAVKKEDLGEEWFQLEVPNNQDIYGRNGIEINSKVKTSNQNTTKPAKPEHVSNPTSNADHINMQPERKAFRIYKSDYNWKVSTKQDVIKSKYGKNTRNAYGAALLFLGIGALALVLLLTLWAELFLFLFVISFIALIVSLVIAAVNARKFTREMFYKKKKISADFKALKAAIWIGLLLTTYLLFPIFLLVTMSA